MNILLVKLGALGDVLRTTPLAAAFKKKYPDCRLTWLVDAACADVLDKNPLIDELLVPGAETAEFLKTRPFDLAINLDKEKEALDAVMEANALKKMGFGRDGAGQLCALDELSDYAVRLGIDDELKFRINQKSYQQISFEQAGLSFAGEEYSLTLESEERSFAASRLRWLGIGSAAARRRPLVGLNTGAGDRFAGKKLPVERLASLAEGLYNQCGASVLLLGGEKEIERNRQIVELSKTPVKDAGSHSIRRFAAIVKECNLVLSGDTTAMHIAIAVKVPVVAYFASTCSAEIELYGRGQKIVSQISCAPCYKKICPIDEQCMKEIPLESLLQSVREVLNK